MTQDMRRITPVLVALVAAAAPSARAEHVTSFSSTGAVASVSKAGHEANQRLLFSGSCPVDVIFPIPVDAERARAFVPDRHSFPAAAAGKVLMFVTLVQCQDTVVDGVPAGDAIYHDLLFQIDTPPEGGMPFQDHFLDGYWSWLVTDSPPVDEGLTRLGMFHGLDPGMSVTTTWSPAGDRLLAVDGTVSWSHAPFHIQGTVLNAWLEGFLPDYEVNFWQDVPGGLVRARLAKSRELWRGAALTLTTPVDSPFAWVLGSQCLPASGGGTCSVSGPGAVTYLTGFEHDIAVLH